jgi:anti-anti-sigma factor
LIEEVEMKLIRAGAGAAIIDLDSEFSSSCEQELFGLVDSISNENIGNLLLNFNHVDWIDNTGINVLVKLYVKSKKLRKNLLAIGVSRRFLDIFSVTGLDKAYQVYASLADVLRAVGSASEADVRSIYGRAEVSGKCPGPEYGCWTPPIKRIAVPQMPPEALNLNVNGRRTTGPVQGFGPLWEKIYTLDLSDTNLPPEQIIGILKSHFPEFQPPENRFYTTAAGIKPGEVILINASTPGGMVATGVLVLFADERAFTFITPMGHPEAGWVSFGAFIEGGHTIIQVHSLARASDPAYEIAFRIAGSNIQQHIWTYLLQSLARYTGSSSAVQFQKQCLDGSLQWENFFNIFWNAQARSMLYFISHPFRKKEKPGN